VYGLFHEDGDRPAYAMRFVEGPTLGDAIQAHHAGPRDPVAFRRLLLAFLQVCQTVAYAHSRGVIHRDLKPQNVMLGKFGETLVVDWGLAKVVGRPEELKREPAGEATLLPESGSGDETALGSAVGTPAYMSPEQAAGRWNVIDPRSDVYGLGAVLYTLLAGKPPLARGDWPELQQKIQRGDFPRPRQVKPDVPRALEAVCLKAMALRPEDRYRSAAALADEVERWLADEPLAAYREPVLARGRRWMRRHRTLVTATALALVTALAAAGTGLVLLGHKNREIVGERNAARAAADEAEAVNALLTEDLLGQADPDVNRRDQKVTVEDVLAKAAARIDGNPKFADKPGVEATLRRTIGLTYFKLGNLPEAERHLRRAVGLRRERLGPEDPKTLACDHQLGWILGQRGQFEEAAALLKRTWEACTRVIGPDDVATLETLGDYALLLRDVGELATSETLVRECLSLAERRHGWHEKITIQAANNLGLVLTDQGKWAEAEPLLRDCVQHCRRMFGDNYSGTVAAINNLSRSLMFLGEYEEAERFAREGYETHRRVSGPDHIITLHVQSLLAEVLVESGRLDEGEQVARACLEGRRKVLPPHHPNLGRTLIILGRALAGKGEFAVAEPLLGAAQEVFQTPSKQPYLAQAQVWRGVCLLAMNRPKEAKPLLETGFPTLKTHPVVMKGHARRAAEQISTHYGKSGEDGGARFWQQVADELRKAGRPSAKPPQ
jgi:tetratricopeptide (TPR) repeat protein